jgi:hypothetical protein
MTGDEQLDDLIVIVADGDMEATIRSLLARQKSLGIRPIKFDVLRHIQRDAGCRSDSHNYLRTWLNKSRFAMVVFDLEGSGMEAVSRTALEAVVEELLSNSGWRDRCAVVVIEPELEAWVWSDSPLVDELMDWRGKVPALREWVQSNTEYWSVDRIKPERPKEAVEAALREARKQMSSSLYEDLAKRVSVNRCTDPSFSKFREVLRNWFGETEA